MNAISEVKVTELEIPNVASFEMPDGVWIGVPVTISIFTVAAREAIAALGRRHEKKLQAQLERERAEREAEQNRIEYLEEQNKTLLREILSLQRAMDLSGPLSPPPNYHEIMRRHERRNEQRHGEERLKSSRDNKSKV